MSNPNTNPQILIYCTDAQIEDELEKAFSAIKTMRPVRHYRDDLRGSCKAARDYLPSIVLVELGPELAQVRELIEEINACSPSSTIVGLISGDPNSAADSESKTMFEALRIGVEDFIRRPASSRDLEQALSRRMKPKSSEAANLGRVISTISNKGGVGKSTIAVNMAVELAKRHPGRVLLIDASLQMGVCAAQLNLQPEKTVVDAYKQRDRLDTRLLRELATSHSSGLDLLAAPVHAIDALDVDDAVVSRIILLARRSYDFVVIDTFPLFDRVSMAILDLSEIAYVITDNVVPTLQTVRGFFKLLHDVDFPVSRQRIVLNRFTKIGNCPNRKEVETYLGRTVDHVVPFENRIIQAVNVGAPFVASSSRFSKSKRAIQELVDRIVDTSEDPSPRLASSNSVQDFSDQPTSSNNGAEQRTIENDQSDDIPMSKGDFQ